MVATVGSASSSAAGIFPVATLTVCVPAVQPIKLDIAVCENNDSAPSLPEDSAIVEESIAVVNG